MLTNKTRARKLKNFIKIILAIASLYPSASMAAPPLGNPIISLQTSVASSSLIAKASSGWLNGFSVTSGATSGYVLIFDAIAAPSNGTVTPKFCYGLPANTTFGASWISYPVPFSSGIVIEFSSTGCFSATSSATAFISAQIQ